MNYSGMVRRDSEKQTFHVVGKRLDGVDEKAKVFIYDAFPGGIGISEQLYEKCDILLKNVLDLLRECECKDGCPSCVQSPKCGNDNFPLDKKVAIMLLDELLNQ